MQEDEEQEEQEEEDEEDEEGGTQFQKVSLGTAAGKALEILPPPPFLRASRHEPGGAWGGKSL